MAETQSVVIYRSQLEKRQDEFLASSEGEILILSSCGAILLTVLFYFIITLLIKKDEDLKVHLTLIFAILSFVFLFVKLL